MASDVAHANKRSQSFRITGNHEKQALAPLFNPFRRSTPAIEEGGDKNVETTSNQVTSALVPTRSTSDAAEQAAATQEILLSIVHAKDEAKQENDQDRPRDDKVESASLKEEDNFDLSLIPLEEGYVTSSSTVQANKVSKTIVQPQIGNSPTLASYYDADALLQDLPSLFPQVTSNPKSCSSVGPSKRFNTRCDVNPAQTEGISTLYNRKISLFSSIIRRANDGTLPVSDSAFDPIRHFLNTSSTRRQLWDQLLEFLYVRFTPDEITEKKDLLNSVAVASMRPHERWTFDSHNCEQHDINMPFVSFRITIRLKELDDLKSSDQEVASFVSYVLQENWQLFHRVTLLWLLTCVLQEWKEQQIDATATATVYPMLADTIQRLGSIIGKHALYAPVFEAGRIRLNLAIDPMSFHPEQRPDDRLNELLSLPWSCLQGVVIAASTPRKVVVDLVHFRSPTVSGPASIRYEKLSQQDPAALTATFQLLVLKLQPDLQEDNEQEHDNVRKDSVDQFKAATLDELSRATTKDCTISVASKGHGTACIYLCCLDQQPVGVGESIRVYAEKVETNGHSGSSSEDLITLACQSYEHAPDDFLHLLFRCNQIELSTNNSNMDEKSFFQEIQSSHKIMLNFRKALAEHGKLTAQAAQALSNASVDKVPLLRACDALSHGQSGIDVTAILLTRLMCESFMRSLSEPTAHSTLKLYLLLSLCSLVNDDDEQLMQEINWNEERQIEGSLKQGLNLCIFSDDDQVHDFVRFAAKLFPGSAAFVVDATCPAPIGDYHAAMQQIHSYEPITRKETAALLALATGQEQKRNHRPSFCLKPRTVTNATQRVTWASLYFKGVAPTSKTATAVSTMRLNAFEAQLGTSYDLFIAENEVAACSKPSGERWASGPQEWARLFVKESPMPASDVALELTMLMPEEAKAISSVFDNTRRLQQWLALARQLRPRFTSQARQTVLQYHVATSKRALQSIHSPYRLISAPLRLKNLMRTSLAHARLQLREKASPADVVVAIVILESQLAYLATSSQRLGLHNKSPIPLEPAELYKDLIMQLNPRFDGQFPLWPRSSPTNNQRSEIVVTMPFIHLNEKLVIALQSIHNEMNEL